MAGKILLIGSIPLGSTREVFETIGARLDGLVRRVPDGETGERQDWVNWQAASFARIPFVETASDEGGRPQFRVRPGFPAASVRFGPLGYAEAAIDSYTSLRQVKASGGLAADCRLQVGIATPLSVIGRHMDPEFQQAVEPAYEQRLLAEIDEITEAVPRGELAIQWNLATELSIMAGHRPVYFDKIADGILERLVRLCEHVPDGVELGLHLCYDDFALNGFPLPQDLDRLVDLANGLLGSIGRAIDWLHMPAPSVVADDAYFAPLRRLLLRPETELYLGLIHGEDGITGATGRIASAKRILARFGIACACGIGHVSAAETAAILDLHRAAAEIA